MALTPKDYLKQATEIEASARTTSDPIIQNAQLELARALRALAAMLAASMNEPLPDDKNGDKGLPKRN